MRCLACRISWLGFGGSLCFFLGGTSGYLFSSFTFHQYQIVTVLTWMLGSGLFFLQGLGLFFEIVNPSWQVEHPAVSVDCSARDGSDLPRICTVSLSEPGVTFSQYC